MKKVIAIVPARGNSKGIPRKNMNFLANRPLLDWTLHPALFCDDIDYVIVTSEDREIIEHSVAYAGLSGKSDKLMTKVRPGYLSQDHVQVTEVVMDALRYFEFYATNNIECVFTLLPTSPFRTSKMLSGCLEHFRFIKSQEETDALVSVSGEGGHHYIVPYDSDGFKATPVGHDPFFRVGRQYANRNDFVVRENGSVYLTDYGYMNSFSAIRPRANNVAIFEMYGYAQNLDIDTEEDWELAEFYVKEGRWAR